MSEPNWKNRTLFHGDNLDFLRAMNSESVDLIATDPPFNKGRDFHATPDSLASGAKFQDRWSWEKDVHQEWVDQIKDDSPNVMHVIQGSRSSYGDDMGAFLCFMAVRLLAMRRVLKDTGSIYLHCDPTASHYLKQLMDAVFGRKNFKNEIVWKRRYGTFSHLHTANKFGICNDNILFYAKSDAAVFNTQYSFDDPDYMAYIERAFRHTTPSGRRYRIDNLANPALRPNLMYDYKGYPHPKKGWAISKEKMEQWDKEGRLEFPKKKTGRIQRRRFLDAVKGRPIQSIWTDIKVIASQASERMGYPTQKPLALYERIVKASSKEGDIVLDPFAGCATTCVAAERLKRRWVGIDIWDEAHNTVIRRLSREGLAVPEGSVGEALPLYGKIHYSKEPPERTDDGETAAPFLRVKERVKEPEGPKWSRQEMYDHLVKQQGMKCQGCDRTFDDPRYLELDHNVPRADGGMNHVTNRILLCSPCNRAKSNIYTLSGLRWMNKKNGWMAN